MSLIDNSDTPSILGKIELRERQLRGILNASAGISYLKNGDFSLINLFSGLGFYERVSLLAEYALSDKDNLRTTRNATLDVTYKAFDSIFLFIRAEKGDTEHTFRDAVIDSYTNQGAVGAQIFLLPYVEFRPEYRLVDTEQYRSTRYAVQVHLFY